MENDTLTPVSPRPTKGGEEPLDPASCSATEDEPWCESEECETCVESAEEDGMDYEHNMTWENGAWVCDGCGMPQ